MKTEYFLTVLFNHHRRAFLNTARSIFMNRETRVDLEHKMELQLQLLSQTI